MKLDQTVADRLRRPISAVWDYIASDAAPIVGEDNEGAIEMSIDAGRLSDIAKDQEADKMIQDLCADNDYFEVLEFLADNIKLVW